METSGSFDINSERELCFSSLGKAGLAFSGKPRIMDIAHRIGRYAL